MPANRTISWTRGQTSGWPATMATGDAQRIAASAGCRTTAALSYRLIARNPEAPSQPPTKNQADDLLPQDSAAETHRGQRPTGSDYDLAEGTCQ
jgi:hypothetical protein